MEKYYIKRPIPIQALQWTGENKQEMTEFMQKDIFVTLGTGSFDIGTLEGTMTANPGDWIIKGIDGEFYPCKNEIFARSYEATTGIGAH